MISHLASLLLCTAPVDDGGEPALAAPEPPARVEVTWRTDEDAFGAAGPAQARVDEDVWLGVVLLYADGTCAAREGAWRDAAGKDHACTHPFTALADWRAQYWRVVPAAGRVHRSPRGQGPPLSFHTQPLARVRPDRPVLASLHDDDAPTPGHARFAVTLTDPAGSTLESPTGADALVLRVRLDDSWMGVLWELADVPVVDGPRGAPPAEHETERNLGMDPHTAIVYALRRVGLRWAYVDFGGPREGLARVDGHPARRGDVVLRADGTPAVLLTPSTAQDAPVVSVADDGLKVRQAGVLVSRWRVEGARSLPPRPPRQLARPR